MYVFIYCIFDVRAHLVLNVIFVIQLNVAVKLFENAVLFDV